MDRQKPGSLQSMRLQKSQTRLKQLSMYAHMHTYNAPDTLLRKH